MLMNLSLLYLSEAKIEVRGKGRPNRKSRKLPGRKFAA
jgi:hypothetical protein